MNRNSKDFRTLEYIIMAALLLFTVINVIMAIGEMSLHGPAFPDDFTMRYRESRYVLAGINPFEVVLQMREPKPEIGPLWDVAGYTPWGMVLGILLNFTFLPEQAARLAYLCFFLVFIGITLGTIYRMTYKRVGRTGAWLCVCLTMAFPAWGTALGWLNFGAVMGVLIFWSVMLIDDHELLAGLLLGLAATKPQLAMPFYLAFLLKRKFHGFAVACAIPLFLWAICAWMTGTPPVELVLQLSQVTSKLAGDLGGWLVRLGIPMSGNVYRLLCAVGAIGLAFFCWYRLKKHGNTRSLYFFAVPAVLSGIWTYSQPHDRTVLLILLMCVCDIWAQDSEWCKESKLWLGVICLALILNPDGIVWVLGKLGIVISSFGSLVKLLKYALLVAGLWFVTSDRETWKKI